MQVVVITPDEDVERIDAREFANHRRRVAAQIDAQGLAEVPPDPSRVGRVPGMHVEMVVRAAHECVDLIVAVVRVSYHAGGAGFETKKISVCQSPSVFVEQKQGQPVTEKIEGDGFESEAQIYGS